jgi:methyl-accepting chemotaxis protein/methyl-accepting chemotaxis protein-1 (serine sensor receptor)
MLLDRWTISKKLYAGCGTFVTLTALASAVAVIGTSRIKGDVDMLSRRAATLQHALTIQATLFKIESQEKSMLWAGLDADRAQYAKSKATVAAEYDRATGELDSLAATADSDADRAVVRALTDNLRQSKMVHEDLSTLGDAAKFSEAQQLINDKQTPVLKTAEDVAAGLVTRHQAVMAQTRGEAATSYFIVEVIIALVAVLALVGSVVGVWIVHGINRSLRAVSSELREGSQLVVNASSQMAVSAQLVSQGGSQQAASLEETSASMEEMAVMTRRNADNSHEAASVVGAAAQVVLTANAALAQMVNSMSSIKDSSHRVSKIIKTIDEIAFQTNILALNAAVEAARAGEAGMGFAVVADEVRNLAQRSAQAAKDTAALIEEAITSSNEGSQRVQVVADAFSAITSNVTQIKSLVDEVSVASKQQALGIDQVTQTIHQMERVTQTSAATAEESAGAYEQLNAQADLTMALVNRLELMVGGDQSEPRVIKAEPVSSQPRSGDLWNGAQARMMASQGTRPTTPAADAGTYSTF